MYSCYSEQQQRLKAQELWHFCQVLLAFLPSVSGIANHEMTSHTYYAVRPYALSRTNSLRWTYGIATAVQQKAKALRVPCCRSTVRHHAVLRSAFKSRYDANCYHNTPYPQN